MRAMARWWRNMPARSASTFPSSPCPSSWWEAFLSAEDKNFYEHGGIDPTVIFRAGMFYLQNLGTSRRPQAPPPSPSRWPRTSS